MLFMNLPINSSYWSKLELYQYHFLPIIPIPSGTDD